MRSKHSFSQSVSPKTYIYDSSNDEWVARDDMPTARQSHFCGRVVTKEGKEEVVVAGGWSGKSRLDTVEIFSVESGTWRTGMEC